MPNDSSTEKMKTSDTISSLETKLRNMKDENKSLEQQLHTVKANLLLREELHEQTLTHERKLLSEAQEQHVTYDFIFIVGSCLFKLEKCIYECIFQPVNV
jgi:predicted RNase H-like nuclease (RuvC/YqgF family)